MVSLGFRSSVILTLSLFTRASTSSLIVSKSPSIRQTEPLVLLLFERELHLEAWL